MTIPDFRPGSQRDSRTHYVTARSLHEHFDINEHRKTVACLKVLRSADEFMLIIRKIFLAVLRFQVTPKEELWLLLRFH